MAKRVILDVASSRVSVVETTWRGIGQQDRCLTITSQPKPAAKTGKVRHVGYWRATRATTPRTSADACVVMRAHHIFPRQLVSRVSLLSRPRLFPYTKPSIAKPWPALAFHNDTITAPLRRVTGTGCQCTLDLLGNLPVLVVHRMQSPRSTTSPSLHSIISNTRGGNMPIPKPTTVRHNSSIGAFIPCLCSGTLITQANSHLSHPVHGTQSEEPHSVV
jgi:hypothetical protein